jgi:hypothetical protein
MSKESVATKRPTTPSKLSAPASPQTIHPGQIAFLGQSDSTKRATAGSPDAFVQALCWPLTSTAWAALTKSWVAIKSARDSSTPLIKIHKGPPAPLSWVYSAVPNLGAPFRENPAEESTLAAWISRAQVSIALSVVGADQLKGKDTSPYGLAIMDCLSGYLDFLKFPGYEPCQLVVAGPLASAERQQLTSALTEAQKRLRDVPSMQRLSKLPLRICADGEVPLPVDFANLVSAAIARFVNAPGTANPVFDAIRPKLVQVPRRIAALEGHRRR